MAPALDRSRSAKLLHLCCREAWIGWISPLVKPFLANSDTELAEFFQTVECGANIRRAHNQENSANRKGKSPLCGSHPKDVVRPVAQEMLKTACALNPTTKGTKMQAPRKSWIMRPEQDQSHKRHHIGRDGRRQYLMPGESRRNLLVHQ